MSRNHYKGVKDSGFVKVSDPLEAIHTLEDVLCSVDYIVYNLSVAGLGCANDLKHLVEHLYSLSHDVEQGIVSIHRESFEHTRQASANMIAACLAGVEVGKENNHG